MGDIREQLLKAGLVSKKKARQAAHQERVHRKEVGHKGIAAEKEEQDRIFQEKQEKKRRLDQERERIRREEAALRERELLKERMIRTGWIRDACGGNRRYFFETGSGRITYLDLSDQAVRRLNSGNVAVVCTGGAVRGQFCLVDSSCAASLAKDFREVLCFWNRPGSRGNRSAPGE